MKKDILMKLGLLIKISQATRKIIALMDEKDPLFEAKAQRVLVEYNEKCGQIAKGEQV